jgi:NADH dehydrogenase FAD-containing subunit
MPQIVAVVGGGYGGAAVAKALDEAADVVLVEPRDAFHHNAAALRAVVRPDWLPQMFLPYDKLLQRGRVVHDRATGVAPGEITLASGDRITADYIVLATGSRYPFPAKSDQLDTSSAQEHYLRVHKELAAAERILLVGAGPVGLELAGEIRAEWPGKQIILVDPAERLLPGFSAELRAEIERQLAGLDIQVRLSTRLAADPAVEPGRAQTFTVATADGGEITADLWLRCHGVTPVTDYLAGSLAATRLPDGRVRVTPTLTVAGHDTVFALGDITDLPEAKQAVAAMSHAEVIAANIKARIDGGEPTAYEPGNSGILLPLGPHGGAGEHPEMGLISQEVTVQYKGTDLFVGRFSAMFGLTPAES